MKKKYIFKIIFGQWEEDVFEPDARAVCVESWDGKHAIKKAMKKFDVDGFIVTSVEYLGYLLK